GTTLGLVEARRQRDLTERAREDAVTNAGKAKEEEGKAKGALGRAEKQWLRAEWLLYASQINLAQQAWESNNAFLAFHQLDSCRRELRGWEHDYLYTLFNSNQRTFRGHTDRVSCVALSGDGKRLVSGGSDRTVRVWDAATGRQTLTFMGHTNSVHC